MVSLSWAEHDGDDAQTTRHKNNTQARNIENLPAWPRHGVPADGSASGMSLQGRTAHRHATGSTDSFRHERAFHRRTNSLHHSQKSGRYPASPRER